MEAFAGSLKDGSDMFSLLIIGAINTPVQLRAKQVPRVASSLPSEMKMVGMLYFFHYILLKGLLNNRLKPIVSCECGRHSKPLVTAGSTMGVAP